jgi:hypothetical protein
MSEAEAIIGIYRGFQDAIGCGTTSLSLQAAPGPVWVLEWISPVPRNSDGQRAYGARYGIDPRRLIDGGAMHGHTPEAWGEILERSTGEVGGQSG